MRALVTGGCGFIGSHVVDRLVAEGHDVTVLDNLSTGRKENIQDHIDSGSVRLVEADVQDRDSVRDAIASCTHVFHLAALADIVPSIDFPLTYFDANVSGTANLMDAARTARIEKFIYAASSSCYGIPDTYPTPESALIRPQYPYALTKWLGEETVRHWGQVYGIPFISLRLFNVYGPRSRTSGTYGAVFGVFLAQRLAGKPLTIVGDGTQSRDFTFVSDVVEAFVAAALSQQQGLCLNVGSGSAHTVNELAQLLGGEVVHVPKRPGEPDITLADTTLIRAQLQWEPRIDFVQGVSMMLDAIEYWRNAPVWDPVSIAEATASWFDNLGDTRS